MNNDQIEMVVQTVASPEVDLQTSPNQTDQFHRVNLAVKTQPTKTVSVDELKQRCPLDQLLKAMHLEQFAKSSCRSPFRIDDNPSWGIFQRDDKWYWKDSGIEDCGDEISFLARYFGIDETMYFPTLLLFYQNFADGRSAFVPPTKFVDKTKADRTGFGPGDSEQLTRLSQLRRINVETLRTASDRGFLVFGRWQTWDVFGLTDKSGKILEFRRLDGRPFVLPGINEYKSHAARWSNKKWPVGIQEAQTYPTILMVQGILDFLGAIQIIQIEGKTNSVAPVALLAAGSSIDKYALPLFEGKHVRIVPHIDDAGLKAAKSWAESLKLARAKKVDFVDLSKFNVCRSKNSRVNDLCDLLGRHKDGLPVDAEKWEVLS